MSDEDSPVTLNKMNMTTSTGKSLSLSMPDISAIFGEKFKLQPAQQHDSQKQHLQQHQNLQQQHQNSLHPTAPKRKGAVKGQVGLLYTQKIKCGSITGHLGLIYIK